MLSLWVPWGWAPWQVQLLRCPAWASLLRSKVAQPRGDQDASQDMERRQLAGEEGWGWMQPLCVLGRCWDVRPELGHISDSGTSDSEALLCVLLCPRA